MGLNLCMQVKLHLHPCWAEVHPETWITWWHPLWITQKSKLQSGHSNFTAPCKDSCWYWALLMSTFIMNSSSFGLAGATEQLLTALPPSCSAGADNSSHKVYFWLYLYSCSWRGRRKGLQDEQKDTKQNSQRGGPWRLLSQDRVSLCQVAKLAA